jgi:glycerol uptake facilitator-like aquaporin
MNRSSLVFTSSRSAGGVLMMRQVAVVVSLALFNPAVSIGADQKN